MKSTNQTKQYTVRGVHPVIDQRLREYARRSHRSLNEVTLEAIRVGLALHASDLEQTRQPLLGLAAFDKAPKAPSPFDPETPIKELYSRSLSKKHGI